MANVATGGWLTGGELAPNGLSRRTRAALALYSITMPEHPLARLTDDLAEWIIGETEAGTSTMLDGLGKTELELLAGALIAKGEERPKSDPQLLRYLRAAKRLLDRATVHGAG